MAPSSSNNPRVVVFVDGRCFHRDRGDKTAQCNVGGKMGAGGYTITTSKALLRGYDRCVRCFGAATQDMNTPENAKRGNE